MLLRRDGCFLFSKEAGRFGKNKPLTSRETPSKSAIGCCVCCCVHRIGGVDEAAEHVETSYISWPGISASIYYWLGKRDKK